MKKFWIVAIQALALCIATPGAYSGDSSDGLTYGQAEIRGNKGNWRNRGNGKGRALKDAKVEAAAQSISFVIGGEAEAQNTQYLDYARRLATTLNQKTEGEVAKIIGSSKTYGLGR